MMNDAEWLEQRRSYKESKGATKRLSFVGGVHDDVVEFSSRKCQTISDSDSDAYQRHLPLIARYYIAFFFLFPCFLGCICVESFTLQFRYSYQRYLKSRPSHNRNFQRKKEEREMNVAKRQTIWLTNTQQTHSEFATIFSFSFFNSSDENNFRTKISPVNDDNE